MLPSAEMLRPYLERIDSSRFYTNFGPLQNEFLSQLLSTHQSLLNQEAYGALTANATLGLELALASLDLPAGSRVAIPAFTFPATASAVYRCGHVPVVFDVDLNTWMLTPDILSTHHGANIHAVMPVAPFGMPQNAQHWSAWSQNTGLPVIIDAAAAFGAQPCAPGVTVVFSFHATKTLSCGEGGLVLTQNSQLAQKIKTTTNFGIGSEQPLFATNAKMSEYHAAVGLAHLSIWPQQLKARNALLLEYRNQLKSLPPSVLCFQANTGLYATSVLAVRVASASIRNQLERVCEAAGIQTRRWYLPLIQHQRMFQSMHVQAHTPNADLLSQTLIGLPFYPCMSQKEVYCVSEAVCQVCDAGHSG
jgi:dTDP-4-amino-4,6-dideoxygalactose transaminase